MIKEHNKYKKLRNKKIKGTVSDIFKCLTRIPEPNEIVFKEDEKIKKQIDARKEKRRIKLEKRDARRKEAKETVLKILETTRVEDLDITTLSSMERKQLNKILHKVNPRKVYKNKLKKKKLPRKHNRCPIKYKVYINSHWWEDRKNKYWQNHSRFCVRCMSTCHIHLHHAKYNSKVFGQEPDEELFALCEKCHKEFHDKFGVKRDMLKDTTLFVKELICG
jgi:hypothetical protein